MRYGAWRTEFFCQFGLLCFAPLTTQKIKILKNGNNSRRYYHFTQVHQQSWSHAILFLRYNMWRIWFLFFILSYFCSFTPLTTQKIKISKKWKKQLENHHVTHVYQKLWSRDVRFLRYDVRQMDGQKKSHKEVCAPFNTLFFLIIWKLIFMDP